MSFITDLKIKAIKFFRKRSFSKKTPQGIFEKIHEENLWSSEESVSGPGSELKSTQQLREGLSQLIEKYSIKTILDGGCGDFNWMKKIAFDGIHYTGMDIVNELIEKNKKLYSKSNITFLQGNIITDQLPCVDLIMCRDVLVHLNDDQIKKALNNFLQSQSSYLLLTSFVGVENKDTFTGDWRPINFQAEPFSFPQPTEIIQEQIFQGKTEIKKQVCLWKRELLVTVFS